MSPCILHWGLDHFVVLERANSKYVVILDPAVGRKRVFMSQVSTLFTGAALELSRTSSFGRKPVTSSLSLKRFFENSKGVGHALFQLLGFSIALQVFVLVTPF